MTRRRRPGARPVQRLPAVVAVGVLVSTVLAAPGMAPGLAGQAQASGIRCGQADQAFRPAWLRIPDVVGRTRVLARGRDRWGTPLPPPLTARGRWQFAWDKDSGIRPGSRRGVVRLTAHTYPWNGPHGRALGNRLLTRLREGAGLVVSGADGERLCYRVVRRVRVRAERPLSAYYSSTGPSRLAILVCSGERRGPGDWSHRTIWYAVPAPAR